MPSDERTLKFPRHIAAQVGLSVNEINALKRMGCPFWGRKTCVEWVRMFIEDQTGAAILRARGARPRRRVLSKRGARSLTNDSPDASPLASTTPNGDTA